jgi:TM2 domain-containing membrane protein YozV
VIKMASPILAALLSFIIPGLGQFYAGYMIRGIIIFVFANIIAILTLFMAYLPIMVVAAIDAYALASKAD